MLALVLTLLLRRFATAAPDFCQPNTSIPSSPLLLPLSPHNISLMAENGYSADVKNIKRFEYLSTMPLTDPMCREEWKGTKKVWANALRTKGNLLDWVLVFGKKTGNGFWTANTKVELDEYYGLGKPSGLPRGEAPDRLVSCPTPCHQHHPSVAARNRDRIRTRG